MHVFLALFLALRTLAAPLPVAQNDASPFSNGGPPFSDGFPSSEGQSGAGLSTGPREWNVLYPRPGAQNGPQSPLQSQRTSIVPESQPSSLPETSSATDDPANVEQISSFPVSSTQPSGNPSISTPPMVSTGFTSGTISSAVTSFSSAAASLSGGMPSDPSQSFGDQEDSSFSQPATVGTASSFSQLFANMSTSSGSTQPTSLIATSTSSASPSNFTTSPVPSSSTSAPPATVPTGEAPLQLSLINNLNSARANAYISALDANGRVVMITAAGFYYLPDVGGSTTPQPLPADIAIPLPATGTLQITIPGFIEGARVWFADGTLDFSVVGTANGPALVEPTAVNREDGSVNTNWGFVELTWSATYGLFANLSFVDFLGLPLAMEMTTSTGDTQVVPGVPRDAVQQVCERLQSRRAGNDSSWANLCVYDTAGSPIRVISPAVLLSQQPDVFPTFFQRYVEQVWQHYASVPLTIDTQTSTGLVTCRTGGDEIQCDGDNRGYARPSAMDIFGCDSGPFSILESDNAVHRAVVPRLCAAFNRATFLLEGGEIQPSLPPSSYYTQWPHNLYSAVIHEIEVDGRGYAFSYDDVTPSVAEGVAGIVAAPDPQLLTVFVGGR